MISAKIIADSKNQFGDRITTFVCTFPRIILAEVNTHRMFSRNSASSRAIPFEKMLKMVEENTFIPIKWMKDHSWMQGVEYFENENDIEYLTENWINSKNKAIEQAKNLSNFGLTKQIVNRLLEPFMWHTAIITATDYENFFALRNHEVAEIHLQELARLMMFAYNESNPKELKEGDWHIPFGDKIEEKDLFKFISQEESDENIRKQLLDFKIKIATARCARVSYLNHDGNSSYEKDIEMHYKLSNMWHWSAFEHCAKTMNKKEYYEISGSDFNGINPNGLCGNFKGFIQYRKMFEDENRKDERVIKK